MPTHKPNQEVKGLHNKNFKTLKKGIDGDTSRPENLVCSCTDKINMKMPIQTQCNPHTCSSDILYRNRKGNTKIFKYLPKS